MSRGVDGLTVDELRRGRAEWWDPPFTRSLLEAIPASARLLAEIGCGLARVAHEVMPHRAGVTYIGIDLDRERLAEACADLAAASYGRRSHLLCAAGEALPLADASIDVVLTAMTLQHVLDVPVVLHEARRVLVPEGVFVAVEPDNLGQRFYFDGPLEGITSAFASLSAGHRRVRLPRDIAIGPRLPALLRAAGFRDVVMRAECVRGGGYLRAGDVAAGLLAMTNVLAALEPTPCDESVEAVRSAVESWLRTVGPETLGQSAWLVPVFVTHAKRGG